MLGRLGTDWLRKEASFYLNLSFLIEISIKQIIITCSTAKDILIMVWKFEEIITIFEGIVTIFEAIVTIFEVIGTIFEAYVTIFGVVVTIFGVVVKIFDT